LGFPSFSQKGFLPNQGKALGKVSPNLRKGFYLRFPWKGGFGEGGIWFTQKDFRKIGVGGGKEGIFGVKFLGV